MLYTVIIFFTVSHLSLLYERKKERMNERKKEKLKKERTVSQLNWKSAWRHKFI